MMRKSKDQLTYQPSVWHIDTNLNEVNPITLNIADFKDVFDLPKIEKEELQQDIKNQAQEDIDKFVQSLDMDSQAKPRFENILKRVIEEIKPDTKVINIINELMDTINK